MTRDVIFGGNTKTDKDRERGLYYFQAKEIALHDFIFVR
jgi:hypothetical protein